MRSPRKRQLQVEALETKTLLSAGLGRPAFLAASEVRAARATPRDGVAVTGTIRGQYALVEDNRPADGPAVYQFTGSGQFGRLGRLDAAATLNVGGFVVPGTPDEGTLTLSNSQGSLTVRLSGRNGGDSSGLPTRFQAIIQGGTGQFANVRGIGTATLRAVPDAEAPALSRPDDGGQYPGSSPTGPLPIPGAGGRSSVLPTPLAREGVVSSTYCRPGQPFLE
jgi:hypothetical protein